MNSTGSSLGEVVAPGWSCPTWANWRSVPPMPQGVARWPPILTTTGPSPGSASPP